MWSYFFMFLALVAGTFIGMGIALLLLADRNKEYRPKSKPQKQNQTVSPPEPNGPEDQELPEVPLTRKMPPKDTSVVEISCAVDGVNDEEHISAQQRKQDNSYNALKRRGRK